MRLDKYLVDEGYYESRNRANEAIKAGLVTVDGKKAKASAKVDENTIVDVQDTKFYVSRAARKLESFLELHSVDMKDKIALDVGSSTGGFAQIVLENGVASIDCVDVGSEQLHISLREDEKVSLYEGTDIREFESDKMYGVSSAYVKEVLENLKY